MNPQPKNPASRNTNLRELAKGEACCGCDGVWCSPETTVLAHLNTQSQGKGMGYKSNDHAGIFLGSECHSWLDQGSATIEEKEHFLGFARIRMLDRLSEIATDPLTRPWKRRAAQWALEQLKERGATA